jgi:8-hydroxy-5-deazaflavin:NADPH oxidoreductase
MYNKQSKIGIIGSGVVGQVLAKGFLAEGNSVMLGTRDVSKPEVQNFKSENSAVQIGTFADTAKFADIIVLAAKGTVAESALELAGKENLKAKIIIDATNPIADAPPVNGVIQFFTDANSSLMEKLQNNYSDAKFVKAFSCVGNPFMYKPPFKEGATMFICGNDDEAKKEVTNILTAFGWETEDMGKVEAARAIEPLCILWCIPGFIRNQWTHAFKLVKL